MNHQDMTGTDENRTHSLRFIKPTPYHLATASYTLMLKNQLGLLISNQNSMKFGTKTSDNFSFKIIHTVYASCVKLVTDIYKVKIYKAFALLLAVVVEALKTIKLDFIVS